MGVPAAQQMFAFMQAHLALPQHQQGAVGGAGGSFPANDAPSTSSDIVCIRPNSPKFKKNQKKTHVRETAKCDGGRFFLGFLLYKGTDLAVSQSYRVGCGTWHTVDPWKL